MTDNLRSKIIKQKSNSKDKKTDWGSVASWYDKIVKDDDSYQAKVILPNLLRVLGVSGEKTLRNKSALDLACGSGYFGNILA